MSAATIPGTMTVIEISTPGGPGVLKPVERPTPLPGPQDVLIRVAAAGVNRPDLMQRLGKYPPPPGASDIPGLEVAGVVAAVGGDVTGWRADDPVMALVSGGGYAEYCVAPAVQCLRIAPGLSMEEAAGVPETFCTVWTNVFERGRLVKGETLLVHGGSSGIGTTAIQLGQAFGARVFATAGTAEKCAACERLGAERAINYRQDDFVTAVRAATGGRGADVILDMVGGDYLPRNLELLAMDGRLVQISFLKGPQSEINLNPVMRKRLTLTGSTLRPRSPAEKGAILKALEYAVWPLLSSGAVRPVLYATFPLRDASLAHAELESGHHVGKIVLTV